MSSSPTKSDIRFVRSLKDRNARRDSGLFVVEGEKMVNEALSSSFHVEKVFRTEDTGIQAMSRMTLLSSPSTALALVRIPVEVTSVPDFKKGGLYLALDSLRDPGNMGTIMRIADWFGIDDVLASADCVDIFNPKVVQSTMGAIYRVKFHYCPLASVLENLTRDKAAVVFGTFLQGENIYEADLSSSSDLPRVIVTGNEANGISSEVASLCTRRLTIPSFASGSGSESLNAAVATGITISEFKRRRD